jgi:DNA-binding response OmpR family regulator
MYSPAYGNTHRVTILCVDDDEMALSLRKMVLESAGYVVFTAASSSRGLKIFKQHHVDFVITDHYLDVGTGSDLAGELRKLSPKLPIMTLSGRYST